MDKATYDRGLKIRKSVLGEEFVNKAIASADDFNRPMQDLTTEYCWGQVWGREGLEAQDAQLPQSCNAVRAQPAARAQLSCAGRADQRRHPRGVRQVFMQVATDCAVPAGIDAFRNAVEYLLSWNAKK